jgi:hypothetical protein
MDSERPLLTSVPTGDARVDEAISGLASLGDCDLAARPAVLQGVHDRLREILGELGGQGELADARQQRPVPPPQGPVLPGTVRQ